VFSGTGYFKFINENGQVDREGTFDRGILIDGKKYIYDANGKLLRTAIITGGKVVQLINEK
jgi:antitoxin component YwqK of YwqJK toxin-antitoxin module